MNILFAWLSSICFCVLWVIWFTWKWVRSANCLNMGLLTRKFTRAWWISRLLPKKFLKIMLAGRVIILYPRRDEILFFVRPDSSLGQQQRSYSFQEQILFSLRIVFFFWYRWKHEWMLKRREENWREEKIRKEKKRMYPYHC